MDAQQHIQQLLDDLVDSGKEVGVQVAAYQHGRLVVDAWAGEAAPGTTVDGQTLFPVFSVSKGILATLVHVLVADGVVDYQTRLASLWPDFKAAEATLAHVLEHSAGLPYFPAGLTPDDLLDQERITALIGATEPAWRPGDRTGYHSLTFGYLVAETLRRATGRGLDDLLSEKLTKPLGIEDDLYVVPAAEQVHRLAEVDAVAFSALQDQLPSGHALQRVVGGLRAESIVPRRITPPGRSWAFDAPLPFGATMTARAGARLYSALAAGGGVELLPADRLRSATEIRRRDVDQILGEPVLKSLGYLHGDKVSGGRESAFGFGGIGGSKAYADPEIGLSFAFTHTRMTPPTEPENAPAIAAALRAALSYS